MVHIHPVCFANVTRSIWAEAFGRKHSQEGDGSEFSSSGTMADAWSVLATEERMAFIAQTAQALVNNPENDFSYAQKEAYSQRIHKTIGELNLEELDVQRLQTDNVYFHTIQIGLQDLLVHTIAPHEKHIRDVAMDALGVDLPPQQGLQTVYRPEVNIYLAMSEENKTDLEHLLENRGNGCIITAAKYSGIPLEEPENGIFACANLDIYISYVQQIEKVMKQVVSQIQDGTR